VLTDTLVLVWPGCLIAAVIAAVTWYFEPRQRHERRLKKEFPC